MMLAGVVTRCNMFLGFTRYRELHMAITIAKAAEEVGITRVGLLKAIKKGKLSAGKDEHGEWQIEPAELFRVYPQKKPVTGNLKDEVTDSNTLENKLLQGKIDLQREQINDLRQQLADAKGREEKILKMMDEQITNIRQLTDQRQEKPEAGRGLWRRLFG